MGFMFYNQRLVCHFCRDDYSRRRHEFPL